MSPFTDEQEKAAAKAAEQTSVWQDLMNQRDTKLKDLEEKKKKSGNAAKWLAWSNLVTQLAKLAGGGWAPVVKDDTTYLTDAFKEADRIRGLYDATKEQYDSAAHKYKAGYIDNARAAHYQREKAAFDSAQKLVDAQNKLGLQQGVKTTTSYEYKAKDEELNALKRDKLNAEIDYIYSRKDLTDAQKTKYKAFVSGGNKPYLRYIGNDGYAYNLDESAARRLVQIIKKDYDNAADKSGPYYEALKDDLSMITKSIENFGENNAAIKDILSKYLYNENVPQEIKDVLKTVNRIPVQELQNIESASSESESETENIFNPY